MAKATKQTKKFAASGKLKDTIKSRRQHQQVKRKAEDRTARRAKQRGLPRDIDVGGHRDQSDDEDGDVEEERVVKKLSAGLGGKAGGVAKTVDELFGAGGLDMGEVNGSDLEDGTDEDEDDGSIDEEGEGEEEDMELNEEQMKKAMKDLEKKDPEFFNYLKENDQDLLEFGDDLPRSKGKGKAKSSTRAQAEEEEDDEMSVDDEEEDDDVGDEEVERKKISVTMKMLRQWQEGMLKVRHVPLCSLARSLTTCQQYSLRSLRKTLIAFRAAAHMNEEDSEQGTGSDTKYSIDSAQGQLQLVMKHAQCLTLKNCSLQQASYHSAEIYTCRPCPSFTFQNTATW